MEEKKTYEVTGTVTISTEEYKDLIYDKFSAEADKDRYMRAGWDKDSQINELKKQVEVLTCELDKYKNFIKKNCKVNSEDSIALFLNIGE